MLRKLLRGFKKGGVLRKEPSVETINFMVSNEIEIGAIEMVNIRNKGKSGEREIVAIFIERMQKVETALGVTWHKKPSMDVKRCASSQADSGGSDIVGIPGMAVEVKRSETLNVEAWWKQCCDQAQGGAMPILFYRKSRMTWKVVMYTMTPIPNRWCPAELSGRDFFDWFEDYYREYLERLL